MRLQGFYMVFRHPDIAMIYVSVARACCEDMVVPCNGTDACAVAHHGAKELFPFCIPNLNKTRVCANCQILTALSPAETRDAILHALEVTQFRHI